MLSKKDVIVANKKFDKGVLVNESSLDFALDQVQRSKNWLKSAAILTRAILIDHVFEEGNKQTAAAVVMAICELNNIPYSVDRINKAIIKILENNITSIKKIEMELKNAII